MFRDLTMIFSVTVSLFSVGFGVYKNIEANNAKAFAYEQAYRILNVVQHSAVSPFARATITDAALGVLGTPPPVIDLSRSSADVESGSQACTAVERTACAQYAEDLATAHSRCAKDPATCTAVDALRRQIIRQQCIACF